MIEGRPIEKKTKNKANTPRGVLGSGRLRLQTWQSQLGEDRREAQHWLGHSEGCGRIEKCAVGPNRRI